MSKDSTQLNMPITILPYNKNLLKESSPNLFRKAAGQEDMLFGFFLLIIEIACSFRKTKASILIWERVRNLSKTTSQAMNLCLERENWFQTRLCQQFLAPSCMHSFTHPLSYKFLILFFFGCLFFKEILYLYEMMIFMFCLKLLCWFLGALGALVLSLWHGE